MFRLIKFGTTILEYYNQVDNISSGQTLTRYQALPEGGALDEFGTQQKHPGLVEYSKTLRLKAATPSALTDLYMGILALRGKRDLLYRKTAKLEIHWKYARLVEVAASRDFSITKFRLIQDIDLRFTAQDVFWHGTSVGLFLDTGLFLDAGLFLDSGTTQALSSNPTTFDLTIGSASDPGRAPTRAIVITVNPGNAPMTNVKIKRTSGETLSYMGTIAVGETLIIDTGAMQVSKNGVDAYASMVFEPTADMATWFSLLPGINPMTVTYVGGGTGKSINFAYLQEWY